MRKYYHAALAIVATISLVSLLFYRHEYNKLRYVLEVFNYFGKPSQKQISTNCTNIDTSFSKFNLRLGEPTSSWQRLDNDLYVYSAYSLTQNEVRAIGVSKTNRILNLECLIFFENEIEPFEGIFKYRPISNKEKEEEKSEYSGYYLICMHTENKTPVGVTFVTESNKNRDNIPILSVKSQSQNLNNNLSYHIIACMVPPKVKPLHELDMITFLSFHELIGINNFVVYDFGIPSVFNNRLKELSINNCNSNFVYMTLPWNFPFSNIHPGIMKDIIEADCFHRAYNNVEYLITLSWNEYVVLTYHRSLQTLLSGYHLAETLADRYKLKTLTFCVNQMNNVHLTNSTFIMFRKPRINKNVIDDDLIFISKPYEMLSKTNIYTRIMVKDLIVIHKYQTCDSVNNNQIESPNGSLLRFAEDVQNSPIFLKFLTANSH